jgi:DNA-binding MarR family transcriptional regulator
MTEGAHAGPRWLDAEEMDAWLALMRVVARLPVELDRQLQRDAGISHFEYMVLAGLSQAPQRTLKMSRLAEFAEGQLPRLSQVVAKLEKRGWVIRRPDPTDGRVTLAILTDEGMATVVATAPGHVATVRANVFDALTRAQVRQLQTISQRLGQRLGHC